METGAFTLRTVWPRELRLVGRTTAFLALPECGLGFGRCGRPVASGFTSTWRGVSVRPSEWTNQLRLPPVTLNTGIQA